MEVRSCIMILKKKKINKNLIIQLFLYYFMFMINIDQIVKCNLYVLKVVLFKFVIDIQKKGNVLLILYIFWNMLMMKIEIKIINIFKKINLNV